MFKGSGFHRFLYKWSGRLITSGSLISMVTGIVIQLPVGQAALDKGWPSSLVIVYSWLADRSIWLFIGAVIFWLIGHLCRLAGDPATREHIQFLLDKFQEKAFHNGESVHHHRVTLFRYKRCWRGYWLSRAVRSDDKLWPWGSGYWPCSGWLVPVMRSGHTSTRMSTAFLAPQSDPDLAEGVAGMAWSRNNTVVLENLPDLPGSKKKAKEYATKTSTPLDLVGRYSARGVPMARSFGATPIEVNNKIWGVLVLDSRNPAEINVDTMNQFGVTIAMISRLLERGI